MGSAFCVWTSGVRGRTGGFARRFCLVLFQVAFQFLADVGSQGVGVHEAGVEQGEMDYLVAR